MDAGTIGVFIGFAGATLAAVYGVIRDAGLREQRIREALFQQNIALTAEIERLRALIHELEVTVLQRGARVLELETEVAHLRALLVKHGIDPG
ncbi:hypothetical protein GIW81_00820 [Hyphomicrobium sp. xq]|uniref:Uncharacterized protein n=1 Tax=Hyphomicrobium album TaxID=2665159 RepID=A0A6I3KFU4_9HYPH|nr:hypothetical protein [Hyphomicrobium album]MTD92870.1 hypothetical protein [Hyphomicrobium album]